MKNQQGVASVLAIALAAGAMLAGVLLGKYAKPDSVPEQAIEAYLETHGIDCDFSADKGKE